MDSDSPFDRRLRRIRRDRAAPRIETADYLHREVAGELIERLAMVRRDFADALALGCAGTFLPDRLRERGLRVTAADPGRLFARAGSGVQCDEDQLPFGDARFDLLIAAGTLDTVNDLPGALALMRRALRPDGLFLAAFAGAGSLPRLRSAMLAADTLDGGPAAPRIHPQIDVRAAGDLLIRAGFALPVADCHRYEIRFSNLGSLVDDLRAMGATNVLAARSRRPLTRRALAAAASEFAHHADPEGRIVEQIEIIFLTAWAPAPDQPQPARRGSATRSLADALKPRA